MSCESQSRHLLDDSVIEDGGSHNLQSKISIIKLVNFPSYLFRVICLK